MQDSGLQIWLYIGVTWETLGVLATDLGNSLTFASNQFINEHLVQFWSTKWEAKAAGKFWEKISFPQKKHKRQRDLLKLSGWKYLTEAGRAAKSDKSETKTCSSPNL